jgi:hypothetical protein
MNGWTNYATWRVNLEIFDNLSPSEFGFDDAEIDPSKLSDAMKERAEYYIECSSEPGLARDYALAFLSDVNWYELAEHMISAYAEE